MTKGYTRRGLLRIDADQGYVRPFGYGFSYWRYDAPIAVLYPLGINWIVWFFREIYFRLSVTPRGEESKAYNVGFNDGLKMGRDIKISDIKNEVIEKFKEKMSNELFFDIVRFFNEYKNN